MKKSLKDLLILAVSLFMISGIITLAGALFKLQHYPYAGTLLIIGTVVNGLSYLVGGIALIQYIRSK